MEKRAKDVDYNTPDRTELPVNNTGVSVEIEEQGGVYVLIVTSDRSNNVKSIYQIAPPNQVRLSVFCRPTTIIAAQITLFRFQFFGRFLKLPSSPQLKYCLRLLVTSLPIHR